MHNLELITTPPPPPNAPAPASASLDLKRLKCLFRTCCKSIKQSIETYEKRLDEYSKKILDFLKQELGTGINLSHEHLDAHSKKVLDSLKQELGTGNNLHELMQVFTRHLAQLIEAELQLFGAKTYEMLESFIQDNLSRRDEEDDEDDEDGGGGGGGDGDRCDRDDHDNNDDNDGNDGGDDVVIDKPSSSDLQHFTGASTSMQEADRPPTLHPKATDTKKEDDVTEREKTPENVNVESPPKQLPWVIHPNPIATIYPDKKVFVQEATTTQDTPKFDTSASLTESDEGQSQQKADKGKQLMIDKEAEVC